MKALKFSTQRLLPRERRTSYWVNGGELRFLDVFACFILKDQGFVKIPGYEPVELDLEKPFLLSVSKENLDVR